MAFAVTRGPMYKQCLQTRTACLYFLPKTGIYRGKTCSRNVQTSRILQTTHMHMRAHTFGRKSTKTFLTSLHTALRVRQHSPPSSSKNQPNKNKTSTHVNVFQTNYCSIPPVAVPRPVESFLCRQL